MSEQPRDVILNEVVKKLNELDNKVDDIRVDAASIKEFIKIYPEHNEKDKNQLHQRIEVVEKRVSWGVKSVIAFLLSVLGYLIVSVSPYLLAR